VSSFDGLLDNIIPQVCEKILVPILKYDENFADNLDVFLLRPVVVSEGTLCYNAHIYVKRKEGVVCYERLYPRLFLLRL
jgi:hypothetical protein